MKTTLNCLQCEEHSILQEVFYRVRFQPSQFKATMEWIFINRKIKHEDKDSEISGIRSNQDILNDKKEIANTIKNCSSKSGLNKGETEKFEIPDKTVFF